VSGYLTLADGSHRPVRDGFLLGRVAGCDLVIDDSKCSRKHARLVVDAGVVEIEDLGSSNGTLLNEKPVQRRVLREGDRVQIGKTVVVFHEGAAPGGAAPRAADPDDNDLFGDGPAVAAAPAMSPTASPAGSPPSARTPPPDLVVKELPARRPEPAPPATPPPPTVVEFADEVVEVRKPAAPAAAAKAAPSDPTAVTKSNQRVLQFQKQGAGKGGLLGDDLGQVDGGTRWLLYLGVLAFAAGLIWLTMRLSG
jgi:predicted component of type VI protein secretion system